MKMVRFLFMSYDFPAINHRLNDGVPLGFQTNDNRAYILRGEKNAIC